MYEIPDGRRPFRTGKAQSFLFPAGYARQRDPVSGGDRNARAVRHRDVHIGFTFCVASAGDRNRGNEGIADEPRDYSVNSRLR